MDIKTLDMLRKVNGHPTVGIGNTLSWSGRKVYGVTNNGSFVGEPRYKSLENVLKAAIKLIDEG